MSRIMAIDYGKVRSGVAITDTLQIIASGLTTVPTENLLAFLKDYLSKETVELLLIGQPKTLQNNMSDLEQEVQAFITKFNHIYSDIPIKRIDERFTSKMAFRTMIDSGMKKKQRQNKAMIDEISATLILQSYLYYRK